MAQFIVSDIQDSDLSDFQTLFGSLTLATGVAHGKQCLQLTKTGGAQCSIAYTPAGEAEDYEVVALIRLEQTASNQRLGAAGSLVDGEATAYGCHFVSDDISLTRHYQGTRTTLQTSYTNRVNASNEWAWARIRKEGSVLKAKNWRELDPEPDAWDLEITDPNTVLAAGKLGVFAYGWGTTDYVATIGIGTNGDTAPKYKNDIRVTRGSATIAANTSSIILTAGVDYQAPEDTSRAYLRITGAQSQGAGAEGSEFNGNLGKHGVLYANPESLDTSIVFERYLSTGTETLTLTYEIIEYVGESGGANEFIVRHNEVITFTSGVDLTKDSAAITGIVNPADCIPFLNGAKTSDNGRGEWEQVLSTGDVFEDKVTLDRAHNSGTDTHSLTLVEFIGSNYTVQRVSHTYVGNGLETETVSVTDYTKTALYVQQRGADLIRSSEVGDNIWLSDNTTLNFDKYAVESGGQTSVVWMLENPYFQIAEYSGTITGSGTATPASGTITISDVGLIDSASIFNVQGQISRNSEDSDHAMISMSLTDSTTVSWSKGMGMHDISYRFQVLEWPQAMASVNNSGRSGFSFGATYTPVPQDLPSYAKLVDASNQQFAYPIAYSLDGYNVDAGFLAPIDSQIQGRERTSWTGDSRLKGFFQRPNSSTVRSFKVTLPRAGFYFVRLASGDYQYSKNTTLRVLDDTVSKLYFDNVTTAIGQCFDAAGNLHTFADWTANQEAVLVEFTSANAVIELGRSDDAYTGDSALNYIEFEPLSVDRVTSRAPQYFQLDGDLWSGSNFYNETTIEIAPDTDCLAVRAGGSIGNIVDITIGGVSLVLGDSQSDGNSARVDFYYLMNPPTGSLTLRVDGSASSYQRSLIINELSGVDTSVTPVFSKSLGYNTARTTTVNGGDGSFIASASTTQDAATLGYDQTVGNVDFENNFLRSGYMWSGYSQSQVGEGDVTVSTTQDLARFGAIITGAFAYASGAGGGGSTTYTKTTSLDSILKKSGITPATSLDALFLKTGITLNSDLSAILAAINSEVASVDAILQKAGIAINSDLGAILKKAALTSSADLTAVFQKQITSSASFNALLGNVGAVNTSFDALLQSTETLSALMDALLSKQKTLGVSFNAVLQEIGGTLLNATLEGVLIKTLTINAVFGAALERQNIPVVTLLDAMLMKTGTLAISVDAVLKRSNVQLSASLNAVLGDGIAVFAPRNIIKVLEAKTQAKVNPSNNTAKVI